MKKICDICGKEFVGNGTTSKCPDCRLKIQHDNGTVKDRLVGTIDKCEMCGKEYTVTASKQKYCAECQDKYRYTKAQGKAKTKWLNKVYDRIELKVPKGERENIKAHAKSTNESLNEFLNRAVFSQMQRDNAENGENNE